MSAGIRHGRVAKTSLNSWGYCFLASIRGEGGLAEWDYGVFVGMEGKRVRYIEDQYLMRDAEHGKWVSNKKGKVSAYQISMC